MSYHDLSRIGSVHCWKELTKNELSGKDKTWEQYNKLRFGLSSLQDTDHTDQTAQLYKYVQLLYVCGGGGTKIETYERLDANRIDSKWYILLHF
jgi:hypothetical protein